MADYKAQEISGNSWQRCYKVTVLNNRNSTPTITFDEQKVYLMPDREVVLNVDSCSTTFDPTGEIALRDPQTGELTGASMTQAELHIVLYSLYIQVATRRDAPHIPAAPAAPVVPVVPFIQPNTLG